MCERSARFQIQEAARCLHSVNHSLFPPEWRPFSQSSKASAKHVLEHLGAYSESTGISKIICKQMK